ncbi:hypothetical protein [Paraburkholderia sp. BL25I1N1]|uniref:hypothetical protein n=1 Tax=Paraburkholderia sp. BL25I1N1 TaxID=1938804 RepID=UPI000D07CE58|nr:hypothetical protein [Paraburkholderia sp. BL25I1N1]
MAQLLRVVAHEGKERIEIEIGQRLAEERAASGKTRTERRLVVGKHLGDRLLARTRHHKQIEMQRRDWETDCLLLGPSIKSMNGRTSPRAKQYIAQPAT